MNLLDKLLKSALSTATNDEAATQSLLDEYWAAYPEAKSVAVVRWMRRQVTYTALAVDNSPAAQVATRPTEDSIWVSCKRVQRPVTNPTTVNN